MPRDVKQLHPDLQKAIKKLQAKFPEMGIGECIRTVKEQDALYAQGRTNSGKIVTNAKGKSYQSQHQWGIAFDFFYNEKGKEYTDLAWFKRVAKYAKKNGLSWGGDWKSFKDYPHLYLGKWGSTTAQLKKLYKNPTNFKKTWEKSKDVSRETSKTQSVYYPKFKASATGLVDGLKSISVDSSFSHRKKIAYANGYKDYGGTATQNIRLYTLGKNGKLKRV